jgi:DNA-binding NtrC family response regulator
MRRHRLLVVGALAHDRIALAHRLREAGIAVETAADGCKALPKLDERPPDVILSDLAMPCLDGLELMRRAHVRNPACAVVLSVPPGAIDDAVAAMRGGAAYCVPSSIEPRALLTVLRELLETRGARSGPPGAAAAASQPVPGIVGSSPGVATMLDTIRRVAPSRATVLITGETGTGKELVAAALHELSPRSTKPFVRLHCAALSETLLESELFGHERGSFTGAIARREGRLHEAHGGTLFLDEIGEVSLATQVKLLRFLQDHEIERVGSNHTLELDVRIVAATNRDLAELVRTGMYREDFYYRLNVVTIEVPPLRERPSDIPLLAMHFLGRVAHAEGRAVSGFDDQAMRRLVRHDWPGNIRELENAVERAVVTAEGPLITDADLLDLGAGRPARAGHLPHVPGSTLAELERWAILNTLEHTHGSTSKAAEILGISPRKVQYRAREYRATGAGPGVAASRSRAAPEQEGGSHDTRRH